MIYDLINLRFTYFLNKIFDLRENTSKCLTKKNLTKRFHLNLFLKLVFLINTTMLCIFYQQKKKTFTKLFFKIIK